MSAAREHPVGIATAPAFSLLRLSALARCGGAMVVIAGLWAMGFWALAWAASPRVFGPIDLEIPFRDLTLGYDRPPAVHHLDGEVESGALLAVCGPNGAGKSTLLKG